MRNETVIREINGGRVRVPEIVLRAECQPSTIRIRLNNIAPVQAAR
jgi:hypothetical protein